MTDQPQHKSTPENRSLPESLKSSRSADGHKAARWNERDPSLIAPFDTWPHWAVELDIEIADLVGDIESSDSDTPEARAALEAFGKVRDLIARMVQP